MTTPERLTIDTTAARDVLEPGRTHHPQGLQLLAMAERGEVVLAVAPQGHRLDRREADLVERLQSVLPGVTELPQVARVSRGTRPAVGFMPGQLVEGFVEAWSQVAKTWNPNEWKALVPPGVNDRYHVESHLLAQRDTFITNDHKLLAMCRRLRAKYGVSIAAMTIEEYVSRRRSNG